jgi:tripartite-type tricarboxylate transporter receptor subunit TctC
LTTGKRRHPNRENGTGEGGTFSSFKVEDKHKLPVPFFCLLGVSSPERLADILEVPTWKEQGIDFVFPHGRGVMAAPGLSAEQKKFWSDTIAKMVESPTWKKALKNLNWDSFYPPAAGYESFLEKQDKLMKETLTDVGLIK